MSEPREWHKYRVKVGRKAVYCGITTDLKRKEQEHRRKWPKGHIAKVGRVTTEKNARKWRGEHSI